MSRCTRRQVRRDMMASCAALAMFVGVPQAVAGEGEPPPAAVEPQALFAQAPLSEGELAKSTGREQSAWMTAATHNSAVVTDNHVGDNNVTGAVNVADSAFQNMSGITMVNVNTGNNSSINAAMSVNLHINYAAPSAP